MIPRLARPNVASGRDIEKRLRARGLLELARSLSAARGCTVREALGRRRFAHYIAARRDFYLALRDRGWTLVAIGALVDRNHSSVVAVLWDAPRKAARKAQIASRRAA